jgi:hypothetical protein
MYLEVSGNIPSLHLRWSHLTRSLSALGVHSRLRPTNRASGCLNSAYQTQRWIQGLLIPPSTQWTLVIARQHPVWTEDRLLTTKVLERPRNTGHLWDLKMPSLCEGKPQWQNHYRRERRSRLRCCKRKMKKINSNPRTKRPPKAHSLIHFLKKGQSMVSVSYSPPSPQM